MNQDFISALIHTSYSKMSLNPSIWPTISRAFANSICQEKLINCMLRCNIPTDLKAFEQPVSTHPISPSQSCQLHPHDLCMHIWALIFNLRFPAQSLTFGSRIKQEWCIMAELSYFLKDKNLRLKFTHLRFPITWWSAMTEARCWASMDVRVGSFLYQRITSASLFLSSGRITRQWKPPASTSTCKYKNEAKQLN